jgi:chromate transporter
MRISINNAMTAITAAVVGVILNLAVWFALHTVFGSVRDVQVFAGHLHIPVWNTVNLPSVFIAVFAMLAIFRFKMGVILTIGCSALMGVLYHLLVRSVW